MNKISRVSRDKKSVKQKLTVVLYALTQDYLTAGTLGPKNLSDL